MITYKTLVFSAIFTVILADSNTKHTKGVEARDKKVFSLFTVVTFPNEQCTAKSSSTTGAKYGTCLSSTECSTNSGVVDGNCASGFGVCCTYRKSTCSDSITKNCTYIQNPSYSSVYTTSGSCAFTVTPLSTDICQLRLDFDKFYLGVSTAGACSDTFTVVGPSFSPGHTLCGTLTGQHLYVENARATTTTKLTFTIGTTTTTATWNVKVSQIECSSKMRAPHDCVQWLTGPSGFVKSYSWTSSTSSSIQIQGFLGTFCIRREYGFCEYSLQVATGYTTAFVTDAINAINFNAANACDGAIIISGAMPAGFCGDVFSTQSTSAAKNTLVYSGPASGGFFGITHLVTTGNTAGSYGFNLQYNQIACK